MSLATTHGSSSAVGFVPKALAERQDVEPRHHTAKLYERLLRDGYAAQAAGRSR
jgi:hypothetical protein